MIYIPSERQRQSLLESLSNSNKQNVNQTNQPFKPLKKMSKQEQQKLLLRLMVNTKKHFQIQASIKKIQIANHKIKIKQQNAEKVQNRLIKEGQKIKINKQNLAKDIQKFKKQNYYRDKPEITKLGKQICQKPIYSRVNDIISKKINKNKTLQQKYKPLFQPTINPYSQFIVEIDDEGDFFQRMIKNSQKAKSKLQFKKNNIQQEILKQTVQKSFVNKKSKIILAQKNESKSKSLITPIKQLKQQLSERIPKINPKSIQILSSKPEYINNDCFSRLSSTIENKKNKQKIKKQMQKQLTFKPVTNNKKQTLVNLRKRQDDEIECEEIFVKNQYRRSPKGFNNSYNYESPHFQFISDNKQNLKFDNNKVAVQGAGCPQSKQIRNRVKFNQKEWSRITNA